jgi:hypothetical protein
MEENIVMEKTFEAYRIWLKEKYDFYPEDTYGGNSSVDELVSFEEYKKMCDNMA